MPRFRVLDAMPLRLLNSWVGSIEIVRTAPGWQQDTNGWSSHPPARSMRNGIVHALRSAVVLRAGRPPCGSRRRTRYSIPSSRQSCALLSWAPSSLTTKTSGLIARSSSTKSSSPMPRLIRHSFTHRSESMRYFRSSCGLTG